MNQQMQNNIPNNPLQDYAALQQRALEISHQTLQLEQERKEVHARLSVYQSIIDGGYDMVPKASSPQDSQLESAPQS